jgi:hypothetical protein
MERDEINAEISLLLDQMEGDLGDAREIYLRLCQLRQAMRAFGQELPGDLAQLERDLAAEFAVNTKSGK